MPYPILTDGLKEDHPEWFDDQQDDEPCPKCGGIQDQHQPGCPEAEDKPDAWGNR